MVLFLKSQLYTLCIEYKTLNIKIIHIIVTSSVKLSVFYVSSHLRPPLLLLVQVLLKENGSLSKDSNVTMEIPPNTTIAYSLIELEIKYDGRYGNKSNSFRITLC